MESVLELTEAEAEEGGPFEVETLHGKDMVYLEPPLSAGDTTVLEGKGVAAHRKGDAAGDHVVRLAIKAGTKRPAPEPAKAQDDKKPKAASAGPSAQLGDASKDDVAKLLAERKAALLAKLKAQQTGPAT